VIVIRWIESHGKCELVESNLRGAVHEVSGVRPSTLKKMPFRPVIINAAGSDPVHTLLEWDFWLGTAPECGQEMGI
jgi:hypothetical protein